MTREDDGGEVDRVEKGGELVDYSAYLMNGDGIRSACGALGLRHQCIKASTDTSSLKSSILTIVPRAHWNGFGLHTPNI